MFPRIVVDELAVAKTTDSGPFNTADELYFALAGSTSQAQIEVPRVSPPPPQDYYGLGVNQSARDIKLWQGYVGQGQYAYLAVILREQDNAQLGAIADAVTGAALGIAAIFVDPSLGPAALSKLKSAATTFVNSLSTDGDQTIGAFAVRVHNQGATLAVDWAPITAATLASPSGPAAAFDLTGNGAHDTVRVRVQQPRLPQVVSVHSGKCLDVENASLADQAKAQQYPKKAEQGNSNQRWFLQPFGFFPCPPVSYLPHMSYVLLAEHSGKALDVADGSMADGAQVQQYTPHYGANQIWVLVPQSQGEFALVNLRSGKCLDVAASSTADHAKIQQSTWKGGANQRWRLE